MSEKLVRQSRRHALSAKYGEKKFETLSEVEAGVPSYVPFGQYTSSASSSAWRMTPWYFSGTFAALHVRCVVLDVDYRFDGIGDVLNVKNGEFLRSPKE